MYLYAFFSKVTNVSSDQPFLFCFLYCTEVVNLQCRKKGINLIIRFLRVFISQIINFIVELMLFKNAFCQFAVCLVPLKYV